MLTKGDEYPIHQAPEPIAYSGTDRNFYDRYFFNGYSPDGEVFFAVAFGVYPHLNIADAHFSVIRGDTEYCVHASRYLNMERMDLQVGPIGIEIIEHLKKLRVTIHNETGISAELNFEGFAFPIEEPRFTHRFGPRAFMDYTRMTQTGFYSGWIEIDGIRHSLPAGTVGTRDRSWGVRPVGAPDQQPYAPAVEPGFFWIWSPVYFKGRCYYYHLCADGKGDVWNTRAASVRDGGKPVDIAETEDCSIDIAFQSGTRYPRSARVSLKFPGEESLTIDFEPQRRFLMRGVGYFHPDWYHGGYKGPLVVEREDIDLSVVDPLAPGNVHVQSVSKITLRDIKGETATSIGILESLILGPYHPYGFISGNDGAK